MVNPEDTELLELTAQAGRIRMTQDNQAQIHRLVSDGILQHDGDSHYRLTEAGQQSIEGR